MLFISTDKVGFYFFKKIQKAIKTFSVFYIKYIREIFFNYCKVRININTNHSFASRYICLLLLRAEVAKFLSRLERQRYRFFCKLFAIGLGGFILLRFVKLNASILQATCYLAVRGSYGTISKLLVGFQLEEFLLFTRNPRLPITLALDHFQLSILTGLKSVLYSSTGVFSVDSRVLHPRKTREIYKFASIVIDNAYISCVYSKYQKTIIKKRKICMH